MSSNNKNRYLQNTRKMRCFKSGIIPINGGSRIHLMFSENLSTTWPYFGHLMAYCIFVQFIQSPSFFKSSFIAHTLFFQPSQNRKLSSKQRQYHSSNYLYHRSPFTLASLSKVFSNPAHLLVLN